MEIDPRQIESPLLLVADQNSGIELTNRIFEIEKILKTLEKEESDNDDNSFQFFEENKTPISFENIEWKTFKEEGLLRLEIQRKSVKDYEKLSKALNQKTSNLQRLKNTLESISQEDLKILDQQNVTYKKILDEKSRLSGKYEEIENIETKLTTTQENYYIDQMCIFAYEGNYNDLIDLIAKKYITLYNWNHKYFGAGIRKSSTKAEKIKKLYDYLENKIDERVNIENFFKQSIYSLTPLIYSIWGFEDKKSENQKIFELFFSLIKLKWKTYKNIIKNELGYMAFVFPEYLENLAINTNEKNSIEFLIKNDFSFSLNYFISRNYNNSSIINFYSANYTITTNQGSTKTSVNLKENKGKVSPLVLSVKFKSIECTNLLLSNILSQSDSLLLMILSAFEGTYTEILSTSSKLIGELSNRMLITKEISGWVDPESLPLITFAGTDFNRINKEDIYSYSVPLPVKPENENLSAKTSAVKFPRKSGSESSYNLIKSLNESLNPYTFRSKIIKYYIGARWNNLWYLVFGLTLLLWINLALTLMIVIENNPICVILFIVINSFLFFVEIIQMLSLGFFSYLGDFEPSFLSFGIYAGLAFYQFFTNENIFMFWVCLLGFLLRKTMSKNKRQRIALETIVLCFIFALSIVLWLDLERVYVLGFFCIEVVVFVALTVNYFYVKHAPNSIFYRFSNKKFVYTLIWQLKVFFAVVALWVNPYSIVLTYQMIALDIIVFIAGIMAFNDSYDKVKRILFVLIYLLSATLITLEHFFDNFWINISFYIIFSIQILVFVYLSYKSTKNESIISSFRIGAPFMILIILLLQIIEETDYFYVFIAYLTLESLSFAKNTQNFTKKVLGNIQNLIFNWNTLDIVRIYFCAAWVVMYYHSQPSITLTWSMICLNFIRGLTGFRCFDGTRYYVRLIIISVLDIKNFLFIFFYTTFAFGVIISVSKGDDINLASSWMNSFDTNLGNFTHSDSLDLAYLVFFLASIMNVIIMLNLLISVLSDTFSEFQVTANENDYMEMAQCIYEIETMLIFNRKKNYFEYLLVWDNPDDEEAYTRGRVWSGPKPMEKNVQFVKAKVVNLQEKFESFESEIKNLKKNFIGLENSMNEFKDRDEAFKKKIFDKLELIEQRSEVSRDKEII